MCPMNAAPSDPSRKASAVCVAPLVALALILASCEGPPVTGSKPATATPTEVKMGSPVSIAPGQTIDLHVSPGTSRAAGLVCNVNFLQFAIPAAPTRPDDEVRRCTFSDRHEPSRYSFVQAPDGSFYLRGVELLVYATASLPMPYEYSECAAIRPHLLSAGDDPASAPHLVACYQAPPLPTEQTGQRDRIWAALPESVRQEGLGRALRNFCWEESSLLGPQQDVRMVPSECELR